MTGMTWVCWRCGASITEIVPLARASECGACPADLHVCRLCVYFDTRVSRQCREPIADEVQNKERANFCGYFQPCADAHSGAQDGSGQARAALDGLFGSAAAAPTEEALTEAERARRRLAELFGEPPSRDEPCSRCRRGGAVGE